MLSYKTCIELAHVIEDYIVEVIDRIFHVFELSYLIIPANGRKTKSEKINILLVHLKDTARKGPFTSSFQMDLLQYMIDHFYRYEDAKEESIYVAYDPGKISYDDIFASKHKPLANSLKRDGYIIKGRSIKKMLPAEIEEAKTENELITLLNRFSFTVAKGHLEQAISNHSQGNWAGANSQFRPFVESLLIDICKKILPSHECENATKAIKLLGSTANPVFLRADLNEIASENCNKPFVEGLWKRLHPEGNHPGLSSEADATFRYHLSIIFGYYLLQRLEARLNNKK
jgi:hypothetical protein